MSSFVLFFQLYAYGWHLAIQTKMANISIILPAGRENMSTYVDICWRTFLPIFIFKKKKKRWEQEDRKSVCEMSSPRLIVFLDYLFMPPGVLTHRILDMITPLILCVGILCLLTVSRRTMCPCDRSCHYLLSIWIFYLMINLLPREHLNLN